MTKTFFTSDTHFSHANIIRLSNRPFSSVEEMNKAMIDNFNEQAGPEDTIFHLGDACMGKIAESLPLIGQINAKVVLVVGNHDRPSRAMQRKPKTDSAARTAKIADAANMYMEYFDSVFLDGKNWTVDVQGKTFAMSHYPYVGDHFDQDRFEDLRPEDQGRPLLHGHVHELWKFKDRQFNVGVDVNDFKLVTEDEVLAWASTL